MRAKSDNLELVLRPYEPGEEAAMHPSMQTYTVAKHINLRNACTLAQEVEFTTKLATDPTQMAWAICLVEGKTDRPIGTTSLHNHGPWSYLGESGIVIFDTDMWRKGVASLAHMARTRYAFEVMGLAAIYSGHDRINHGSRKALEKMGYRRTGTDYHRGITGGEVCVTDSLLVVNPERRAWNFYWGNTKPPKRFRQAREVTKAVLEAAKTQITIL